MDETIYIAGDKVQIKSSFIGLPRINSQGRMNQYAGSVMTVTKVCIGGGYKMAEDEGLWRWEDAHIAGLVQSATSGDSNSTPVSLIDALGF